MKNRQISKLLSNNSYNINHFIIVWIELNIYLNFNFIGKTGNCWLYDIDKFRKYLHGAAFAFMIIGSLFDIGIIIMANRIKNLYGDEEEDDDLI